MRRKVSLTYRIWDVTRIIPAHAEKSLGYEAEGHGLRDHPRSCGEKT